MFIALVRCRWCREFCKQARTINIQSLKIDAFRYPTSALNISISHLIESSSEQPHTKPVVHKVVQPLMQSPIIFFNQATKRDTRHQAHHSCVTTAKGAADVIRTCLGPQAMMKMILDLMGTLVITRDGNATLGEIDVAHQAR
jgi:hypothetical protein